MFLLLRGKESACYEMFYGAYDLDGSFRKMAKRMKWMEHAA
jgi:hypothetical protein